jgi:5-methylcytosine-specific restriction endonuclease McrA
VSGSRLRLKPGLYKALRQQVLRRDDWRCQSCGAMSNLEVHHQEFRSHSGSDSEENLITLCSTCHAAAHGQKRLWGVLQDRLVRELRLAHADLNSARRSADS